MAPRRVHSSVMMVAFTAGLAQQGHARVGGPVVQTECGLIQGETVRVPVAAATAIDRFLGIPFAAPPVGSLRWQPPAPAVCWKGTLQADQPGAPCLQKARFGHVAESSEDCLRLHVWRPAASKPSDKRPVLVWLHGGDLIEGSALSVQSFYGSEANLTLTAGAVVVGVEYRLGVAGFLALDALATRDKRGDGKVGNYGLLDVIAALRWIQRNINSFGGDPGRVTVAGQSSGGSLVFALLASPNATGLLQAGISMSGSPRLNSTTEEAGTFWHQNVVKRTSCAPLLPPASSPSVLADCLLNLNASELVDALPPEWSADAFSWDVFAPNFHYAPLLLIDGVGGVLPWSYLDATTDEVTKRGLPEIPVVVGVTRQESDFGPGADVRNFSRKQLAHLIHDTFAPHYGAAFAASVVALYLTGKGKFEAQRLYSEILTDATILCPNVYLASRLQSCRTVSTAPVYAYALAQELEKPFCVHPFIDDSFSPPYCPEYSFHSLDEIFWFEPFLESSPLDNGYTLSARDRNFSGVIQKHLGAFLQTGTVATTGWRTVTKRQGAPLHDMLPNDFAVVDLRLDGNVSSEKADVCRFWLHHKFYELHGLIN